MPEDRSKLQAYPAEVDVPTLRNVFCKIADTSFNLRKKNPKGPLYPILIMGEKGIGKTELMGSFAEDLTKSRGETVHKHELYLSTQDQAELLGMPYHDKDGNVTDFARPKWMPDPDSEDCHIIVVDEFNRARPDLQQTMLPFSVAGQIHTHFLPKKSIVVFLCNPASEDYHVSHFNDAAFYDRMARFSLSPTLADWLDHAEANGVSPVLIQTAMALQENMIKTNFVRQEDSIVVDPSNRTFSKLGVLWNEIDDQWLKAWGPVLAHAYAGQEFAVSLMQQHNELLDTLLKPEEILNDVTSHKAWLDKQNGEESYEAGKFSEMNMSLRRYIAKNFDVVSKNDSQLKNLAIYLSFLGDDQLFQFNTASNLEFEREGIDERFCAQFFNRVNALSGNAIVSRIFGHEDINGTALEERSFDLQTR